MPLSFRDWDEIYAAIRKVVGDQGEPFQQVKVIRSDPVNKLVWAKEFGDTPIPLFTNYYQISYTYKDGGRTVIGKTVPYSNNVEVLVPKVGDIILVAQHLGSRVLPKCIGVLASKNFIQPE